MPNHALLSASSSHRWFHCPPSARLCEGYDDKGSNFAAEGTDAHTLCEYKLRAALGMEAKDPTEDLSWYDAEMEESANGYASFVMEMVEEAKRTCPDPVVLIEQKLDYSRYVAEGFGTGDCVIIADGTLHIVDFKYGRGVLVEAEDNPQMMLYALGALELFDCLYDIDTVSMTIDMKKSIALLLILTLCLSLAACGKAGTTGNTDYDYIITLLDRGEYDMAIQIIEMLRSNGSVVPEETPAGGQSEPADSAAITSPGETSFDSQAEIINGTDYRFDIQLINGTGRQLTLHSMKIVDYENGNIMGECAFYEKDYRDQNWYVLPPNTGTRYEDMHPYPVPFERRDYIFTYQDEDGTEYIADYIFQMQEAKSDGNTVQNAGGSPAVDYAQDLLRDLVTLRHDAGFQVEVRPGVYWVPANALGGSRYTNAEISQMLEKSPEEKQADVSTLYEALQLYQVGRFCSADDNICMEEDGIVWEHHKPGYDAVVTNCGCCATDSNWLHYILNGDYDEVGYIGMSQRDGNGHVINYILQDGWYYMIDLTHYRAEEGWLPTAIEDGDLNSYHNSDIIFGNIHKTRSLQDYVDYIQETFSDPPGLIERHTADDVPACACVFGQDGAVEILYAEMNNIDLEILFDDPADSLTFRLAPAPTQQPNWQ